MSTSCVLLILLHVFALCFHRLLDLLDSKIPSGSGQVFSNWS